MFEYGTPEWLNELRLLLGVGFVVTGGLLVMLNWPLRRKAPPAKSAYCPLHRRQVGKCPPGAHDE